MLNNKKSYLIATTIFVVAQIILGVLIQFSSGKTYSWLTISVVALCFIFVLLNFDKKFLNAIMLLTMFFTVCADLFLCGLIENENAKLIAMIFFNLVQKGYLLRIYFNHQTKKQRIIHLSVRGSIIFIAVIATVLVLKKNVNALAIVSLIYYANLIVNIVFAFMQTKFSILLPLGLVLFILCDTFVGLNVMEELFISFNEGSFLYRLAHPSINVSWLFYVPSQILLALSVRENLFIKRKQ